MTGAGRGPAAAPRRLFTAFVALHVGLWTLVPTLFHANLPLDVVEALAWGREWQWGYYKHPPLSAWLAELAGRVAGGDWGLYLLSQLCVAAAFYAAWRLANDFVSPAKALVAVLLLEGVVYHNLTSPEFNVNLALLACWAWTLLAFWRAVQTDRVVHWVACGVFAGLGLLGKYLVGFLLLPLLLFLFVDPASRRCLRGPGPYLGLFAFLAVIAPHVVWVWQNDFVTLQYGLRRAGAGEAAAWARHLVNPLRFLAAEAAMLILPLLLLRTLGPLERRRPADRRRALFLALAFIGPVAGYLLLSAATGMKIRTMWGTPLFAVGGLFLVYFLAPVEPCWNRRRFTRAWAGLFALLPALYAGVVLLSPWVTQEGKRLHFDGRELAARVESAWREAYGRSLEWVVGDEWLGGNAGWYGADRPGVYLDADPRHAPWVSDAVIRERGGVILWEAGEAVSANEGPDIGELRARFGRVIERPTMEIGWGTATPLAPARVGWAVVPPADRR